MAIDALRDALVAEGRERAAAVRREAETRASRVRADAGSALARRVEEALREREARMRRELGARLAEARRAARGRALAEREALLARVFEAAAEALPAEALASSPLREAFTSRLGTALAQLEGDVRVRCPPALASLAERVARGHPDARVEPDPEVAAGFRAHATASDVEIDATLPRLLALKRPQLAIALLARLSAGPDAAGDAREPGGGGDREPAPA